MPRSEPFDSTPAGVLPPVFDANQGNYALYCKTRIKKPTDEKNLMRVWNSLYDKFLPIEGRKKMIKGERTVHYFIKWEKCDQV